MKILKFLGIQPTLIRPGLRARPLDTVREALAEMRGFLTLPINRFCKNKDFKPIHRFSL